MALQLSSIVKRIAEAVPVIDRETNIQRTSRKGEKYLMGARTLGEQLFVKAVADWWHTHHPTELPHFSSSHLEHPYPESAAESCDLVICGADSPGMLDAQFEWAIEVKYLALVGDNGKNNDYVLQKLLSPYLKDRSVIHDARRLSRSRLARRRAVIVVGFDFDGAAVEAAFDICRSLGISDKYARNLRSVVRRVDPNHYKYRLDPVLAIAHQALEIDGLVSAQWESARFAGLTRHPCGTEGMVCGWEVLPRVTD